MDDSTRSAVLVEALGSADLVHLWHEVTSTEAMDLETAEATVRDGMLAIGARLLAAAVAAQGTGKTGTHRPCACGGQAVCEGYRAKQVQTVVGWITMRRAYYRCSACGHGHCPLDAALGLHGTVSVPGCGAWPAALGRGCRLPRPPTAWPRRRGCGCRPARCAPSPKRWERGANRNWRPRSPRPGRRGCRRCRCPAGAAVCGHGWRAHPGHRRGRTRGQGRGGAAGAPGEQAASSGRRPATWPG